jgi:hypothetical protein
MAIGAGICLGICPDLDTGPGNPLFSTDWTWIVPINMGELIE